MKECMEGKEGVTRLETSRPSPQVEFPGTDSEVEICGQEVSGKGLWHLLKSERSMSRQRERLNCDVAYASESSEAGVAKDNADSIWLHDPSISGCRLP